MTTIPRAALLIGLAGLAPFVWGALTALLPLLARPTTDFLGTRFSGIPLLVGYGTIILCFLSGALWGLATRSASQVAYYLSVVPALWAFLAVGPPGPAALRMLLIGFLGILALDTWFWLRRYAPDWWLGLRLGLTAAVVLCLVVGLYYG